MHKLVLASKSPRRHEIFDMLGLNYISTSVEIDEQILATESPENAVKRIARKKAESAAKNFVDYIIISADTIVVCDNIILGKPRGKKEAYDFLSQLSGKSHQVVTGVCLYNPQTNYMDVRAEKTTVFFRNLTAEEINHYIKTKEPYDKAGAYGIQGRGALLIERIEGSYYNVVGLPITTLYLMLKEQNINILGGTGDGGI